MAADFKETVIDHVGGIGVSDDWCGVSTGEMWVRNKLERLAEEYPDEVECISRNADGSVYYHVPWRYVHIFRPRDVSEEERLMLSKRLREAQPLSKTPCGVEEVSVYLREKPKVE